MGGDSESASKNTSKPIFKWPKYEILKYKDFWKFFGEWFSICAGQRAVWIKCNIAQACSLSQHFYDRGTHAIDRAAISMKI